MYIVKSIKMYKEVLWGHHCFSIGPNIFSLFYFISYTSTRLQVRTDARNRGKKEEDII